MIPRAIVLPWMLALLLPLSACGTSGGVQTGEQRVGNRIIAVQRPGGASVTSGRPAGAFQFWNRTLAPLTVGSRALGPGSSSSRGGSTGAGSEGEAEGVFGAVARSGARLGAYSSALVSGTGRWINAAIAEDAGGGNGKDGTFTTNRSALAGTTFSTFFGALLASGRGSLTGSSSSAQRSSTQLAGPSYGYRQRLTAYTQRFHEREGSLPAEETTPWKYGQRGYGDGSLATCGFGLFLGRALPKGGDTLTACVLKSPFESLDRGPLNVW